MSQSYVNTSSFPLDLGSPRIEEWVWPKFTFQFEPFKGYSRFLRYPGPGQGPGYRMLRVAVIVVLRIKGFYRISDI